MYIDLCSFDLNEDEVVRYEVIVNDFFLWDI